MIEPRNPEATLEGIKQAAANGTIQIGPEGKEQLAAECVIGLIEGKEDGPTEVKYIELSGGWTEGVSFKKPGFEISWGISNFGFGTLTFFHNREGKLALDAECMSRSFCEAILWHFLDEAWKNTHGEAHNG